jgi:glucose-6-phosphate-specific signal transduction histidine kinase
MQEILNNAIKHGAPTELSCVSDIDQHTLTITVTNQGGIALDHSRCASPGHGLLNIRKRIAKFPAGAFALLPIATGARAVLSFSLVDRPAEPTHPPTSTHSVT